MSTVLLVGGTMLASLLIGLLLIMGTIARTQSCRCAKSF
jgi:hypothetical protein